MDQSSPDVSFQQLWEGVRRGDEEAINALIQQYMPYLRTEVRYLATKDPALNGLARDSSVCFWVLENAYFRMIDGLSFDRMPTEAQLKKYLKIAIRNRYRELRRKHHRERPLTDAPPVADHATGPHTALVLKELGERIHQSFTPEEARWIDARNQGASWGEIARQAGVSERTIRRRLKEARERVYEKLFRAKRDE